MSTNFQLVLKKIVKKEASNTVFLKIVHTFTDPWSLFQFGSSVILRFIVLGTFSEKIYQQYGETLRIHMLNSVGRFRQLQSTNLQRDSKIRLKLFPYWVPTKMMNDAIFSFFIGPQIFITHIIYIYLYIIYNISNIYI